MSRADHVVTWLVERIGSLLGVEKESLAVDVPFVALGLSSLQAVELSDDLQRWTGLTLSPTFAYDYPSITAAAVALAEQMAAAAQPVTGGRGEGPGPSHRLQEPIEAGTEGELIAIVGIGCRFPGADGPTQFWDLLRHGVDAISEVPADRWNADELYDPDPDTPGRMTTKWGGFLPGVDHFDADFFGIAAREAVRMDPQQRQLLEVAWTALDDAGIGPRGLAATPTGVFIGASSYDHGVAVLAPGTEVSAQDGTGAALSVIANRLSYCLNLAGPSLVVDTACSSSLVAVHLACQSLRAGESELALAGGVNVIAGPRIALSFSKGRLMAPDGRCKPFDERADGYVRSEGAGVVVLKRLDKARADGDRVYAVIRGSAVNQDGRTNGLIAPSRPAQERVLRAAYRNAGVDPASVAYVEAHGTGTAVGDPIEVGALATVLGAGRDPATPLRIGSAKSNLGHLEAAAGIAGMIKTALSLHHRQWMPSLHFQRPNPRTGLDTVPVVVQTQVESLPVDTAGSAVAGTSSFGFGGTNAHVVLSTAPTPVPRSAPRTTEYLLFPVSAQTEAGLRRRARGWAAVAERDGHDPGWLARAAATAARRADHDTHRAAVIVRDVDDLVEGMTAIAEGERARGICGPRPRATTPRQVGLIFPGQGSQWDGMGRGLAQSIPAFREAIERADTELSAWLGEALWSADTGLVAHGTAQVPPALFAMQVALAQTWRAFGVEPAAVCGHSMGEIAAAHISGALSLADAARVVSVRSRLLTEISGHGGLALVELDAAQLETVLAEHLDTVSVAAVNGPRATVLSGPPQALDEIVRQLEADGVFARRIAVDFAAHSPAVEPLRPRLRAGLEGITARPPALPWYSTVTGAVSADTLADGDYWSRNLRETVLFDTAVGRMLSEGHDTFVEIAPHPVLSRSLGEIAEATSATADVVVVSSTRRDEDEVFAFLHALGEIYVSGVSLDWEAIHPDAEAVAVPSQGWNHQRFPLIRALGPGEGAGVGAASSRLIGARVSVGTHPELGVWPIELDAAPEIADHVVDGVVVVPGAYWLAAAAGAAAAGTVVDASPTVVLSNVSFDAPLVRAGGPVPVQLVIESAGGRSEFAIISDPAGTPLTHARGWLDAAPGRLAERRVPALDDLLARCAEPVSIEQFYADLAAAGLHYGPAFRSMTLLRRGDGQAIGKFSAALGPGRHTGIHPALLDACLHTIAAAAGRQLEPGTLPLPSGATRVQFSATGEPITEVWCHARIVEYGDRDLTADLVVLTGDGTPIWSAMDFQVTKSSAPAVDRGRLYRLSWTAHESAPAPIEPGRWLVLGADTAPLRALAARLSGPGDSCVLGNPDSAAGLDALPVHWDDLAGIVDARGFADPGDPDPVASADRAAAAISLARSLTERFTQGSRTPRLWLLTAHTQQDPRVGGLSTAALWGVARVIATEHPELRCGVVDLPAAPSAAELDRLVAVLRHPDPSRQWAIGATAAVPRLLPAPRARSTPAFDAELGYLVTGGLGGLGLRLAQWLSSQGVRRLMLLGRSAPTPHAALVIEELRSRGAQVEVAAVDLADADALEAVVASASPLGGVFHLAGVLEDGVIGEFENAQLDRAFAGKARGAWNLHRATLDQPIEHFVLFSSLAGMFGSPGQAAYAAANTYLDALASARVADGLPAVSIAWGPWAEIGLAAAVGSDRRLAALGVPALAPDDAMALLAAALTDPSPVLAAAAFDLTALAGPNTPPSARELLTDLLAGISAIGADAGAAPDLSGIDDPFERAELVRQFVLGQVATIVGATGAIDPTVPFRDLGFDSLMAVDLRNRLEAVLGQPMSASMVFAYPTVDQLVGELIERMSPSRQPAPVVAEFDAVLAQATDDELADLLSAELDLNSEGESR